MEQFKVSYTKEFERQIDRELKQKQFFKTLYEPIMEYGNKNKIGNNLKNNEQIVICFKSEKGMTQKSFNNIDDIILYLRGNKQLQYCETYFNLHTSTTGNRKTEDLQTCIAIGLDYDKKDFPEGVDIIDYVQGQFKKFHLFYNIVVDTSHGYHFYILLEPTTNIELVTEVTKQIAELTGADTKACKPTQLLRIPYTYNNKKLSEGKRELVKLVNIDSKYQRKNINSIANRIFKYTNNNKKKTNKTFKGTTCKRIEELTSIPCNHRHDKLLWLYGKLLQLGNTEGQIGIKLEQFQDLNKLEDFEYQIKWLKENGKPISPCGSCEHYKECRQYVESDFEHKEGETWFDTTEVTIKKCKKKKGVKQMNGNMLVIYALLKVYYEGISQTEILNQLSKNKEKKPCISKPTLIKLLKEMEEMKLIEVKTEGKKKLYKLNSKVDKTKHEEYKFSINYACANMVIQNIISAEDMRLYCYMRYLHNVENRTSKKTGNVFSIRQMELAELYGDNQGNISKAINRLLDVGILGIHYRGISSNNNREYYVYKLLM